VSRERGAAGFRETMEPFEVHGCATLGLELSLR